MIRHIGWLITIAVPAAIMAVVELLPAPGAFLAAGALIGVYAGYLLVEHAAARRQVPNGTIAEQVLFAALVFVLLLAAL